MKMKEACKYTGLTDKAIRLYIERQLIFPSYTENYMGRKSFNFSETDVEELKMIATLRKYDFSISEIEYILTPEGDVQRALENHITETKEKTQEYLNSIHHMMNSLKKSPCTPQELCNCLGASELEPETTIVDNIRSEQEENTQKKKDFMIAVASGITLFVLLSLVATLFHLNIDYKALNGLILSAEIICSYKLIQKAFNHLNNPFWAFIYTVLIIVLTVYSFAVYL